MRRFVQFFLVQMLSVAGLLSAVAAEFTLLDGQVISGEPISYNDTGVVIRDDAGQLLDRIAWDKFSQEALKQLMAQARSPRDKAAVEPYIEDLVQEKAQRKEIVIKPVERPERPASKTGLFALFASPVGLAMLGLIYLGNLFAAYEIAFFRNQPPALVCGLAAVAPFIVPIIFVAMPTRRLPTPEELAEMQHASDMQAEADAVDVTETAETPVEVPVAEPAAPKFPPTVTYARGEFTFNRRFFETKLAGFLRMVPAEADKDMVMVVKSMRGEYVGRRISQITPGELLLQTFKGNATADEIIPYTEIQQVQVRHKDAH